MPTFSNKRYELFDGPQAVTQLKKSLLITFILIIAFTSFASYLYFKGHISKPIPLENFSVQPTWIIHTDENIISTPLVQDKFLFIRTTGSLCKYYVKDLEIDWCVKSRSDVDIETIPLIYNDYIAVPENDSIIAVFSTENGRLRWRAGVENATAFIEALSISDEKLFVARYDQKITAYNLVDGDILWSDYVPSRSSLYLASDPQTIFLAGGRKLIAYDIASGDILWSEKISAIYGPILLLDKVLYITLYRSISVAIAFDTEKRTEMWRVPSSFTLDFNSKFISYSGNNILIGDHQLIAINKDSGQITWNTDFSNVTLERPIAIGDQIYIKGENSKEVQTMIYSLESETGQITGRLLIQTDPTFNTLPERSPNTIDDLLIVPFGDGLIYAYPTK